MVTNFEQDVLAQLRITHPGVPDEAYRFRLKAWRRWIDNNCAALGGFDQETYDLAVERCVAYYKDRIWDGEKWEQRRPTF